MSLLQVADLSASYGPVAALHQVSFAIEPGQIVALVGANGAGKSTLLMSLCGKPKPLPGSSVRLEGTEIAGLPSHRIARLGIAQSPEGRRVFPRMTVLENLRLGATLAPPERFEANLEQVFAWFPRLKERAGQRGGTLSGGEQQMLAIARALLAEPRLLLLDEPSLGLAPLLVRQIFDVIARINRERGIAILLVEQAAHLALKLAHQAHVLVNGRITLSGTGAQLLADPSVQSAYLDAGTQSPGTSKG